MKIYFLFERNKKLLRSFIQEHAPKRLFVSPMLQEECRAQGVECTSLDDLGDFSQGEMSYALRARAFLDELLVLHRKHGFLRLKQVSFLEINTAPLILYYLQKSFRLLEITEKFLNTLQPIQVILSSSDHDVARVVYEECLQRKIEVEVLDHKRGKKIFPFARSLVWFLREIMLSFRFFGKRQPISPCHVLMVCNVKRQFESFIPVIEQLLKRKNQRLCVLTKFPLDPSQRIVNERLQYITWASVRSYGYIPHLLLSCVRLLNCERRNSFTNLIQTHGFLRWMLQKWFSVMCLRSVRALELSGRVLQKTKPQVIVVSDVSDYEAKSITALGKFKQCKTFCLQYGMLAPQDSEWHYLHQDYVGAFDHESAHIMAGHGIEHHRIIVTGNPRFDLYRQNKRMRNEFREIRNIPKNARLVAFMSVPVASEETGGIESGMTKSEYETILETIYGLLNDMDGIFLVVKPHPEEDISIHQKFRAASQEDHFKFVTNCSAYELLNAADIVITLYSTTALEAVYLDKPLFLLNFRQGADLVDIAERGAAVSIRSREELVQALRDYFRNTEMEKKYGEGRKQYLAQMGIKPGESASRCAEVIMSLH